MLLFKKKPHLGVAVIRDFLQMAEHGIHCLKKAIHVHSVKQINYAAAFCLMLKCITTLMLKLETYSAVISNVFSSVSLSFQVHPSLTTVLNFLA